jgi:Protein of unknown function (DUF2783)
MNALNLEPNIDRPDDLYAEIVEMTAGHTDAQAFALQARLILLLANQIGDVSIIAQLVRLAAQNDEHDLIDSENLR